MNNKAGLPFTPHIFFDIGHQMTEHVCYSDKNINNTDDSRKHSTVRQGQVSEDLPAFQMLFPCDKELNLSSILSQDYRFLF